MRGGGGELRGGEVGRLGRGGRGFAEEEEDVAVCAGIGGVSCVFPEDKGEMGTYCPCCGR